MTSTVCFRRLGYHEEIEETVPVLLINQQPGGAPDHHRISVSATEIPGVATLDFDVDIKFEITPEDGERIRWYLEDFLQFDEDPAPQIAEGVEAFMAECGERLFSAIFDGSKPGRLWMVIQPHLSSTRIEISTGVAYASTIPWELIRDPNSKTFLALAARSFVHTSRQARNPIALQSEAGKVRVLFVISRPQGGYDVPFRSVGGKLATGLSTGDPESFQLDVLRPPTFERLAHVLDSARGVGRPYHVVHFDGHGIFAGAELVADGSGPRGFLIFENPDGAGNSEFVDGFRLGRLLRDNHVAVLLLNAGQSAYVESRSAPTQKSAGARAEIEPYISLAQAVVEAGVAGVVAMRYSVYAATAVHFMADLYAALVRGRTLGEAVTWARKNLHDQPARSIVYEPRPLQDWSVPVVWESAPLRLWPERLNLAAVRIALDDGESSKLDALDGTLPPRPDIGFYGRDETLYALDRGFDTNGIVLLHALAGSGKTATVAEFARWYALTGGIEGPVLFTSFERYLPLARLLDKIGSTFSGALVAAGIHWDAVTDLSIRRNIALQVLEQVPVLWIWDNIEPVTGFPAATASDWRVDEQEELRAFLSAARDTKAKFLLVSRRDERAWLGDLPYRVQMPAMPMLERLQLAAAVLARRGRRLADFPDLTPLLRFTRGNPLTILITMGEAVRADVRTQARLDAFVEALRSGEAAFEDEESEGRSKSLGASLSYGFNTAFADSERSILALLHLFQGSVRVDVLRLMGNPEAEWCLDVVRGLSREHGISLLDRAAEIGLLMAREKDNDYYGIHPALPWYFRRLFQNYFPEATGDGERARRAFALAMGVVGYRFRREYSEGDRGILSAIAAEEDNLLAAWQIARAHGWWSSSLSAMDGLRTLYEATGRRVTWRRLVNEVVPEFIDPATGKPSAGHEEDWGRVVEYCIHLAMEERDWAEAERLQHAQINWSRRHAETALAVVPEARNQARRDDVRRLGLALVTLGDIQREQRSSACIEAYHEAFAIAQASDDATLAAYAALRLGNAHKDIAELRDLDEAERWYKRSLEHDAPDDLLARGTCLGQLGLVAYERFKDARAAKRFAELSEDLFRAAQLFEQALQMLPSDQIDALGATHNQLGNIYAEAGEVDRALKHYRQSTRYSELSGDLYGSGLARSNAARSLAVAGRFSDAQAYAQAALDNFRVFGNRADSEVKITEQLMAAIERAKAHPEAADERAATRLEQQPQR